MPTTKKTMSRSEATPKRSSSASRGASTSGKQSLSFYTTGENMTDMIRNSWVSDTPKHALKICREGLGMSTEQALEVITGKKKLTGDSRDGGLGWEDDNQTQISGIKLDVDTMLNRLESKWIDTSESINVFNGINVNDGTLEYEDDMSSLEYYKNKLADTLEQLQEVYLLVGKSLKNLPSHKVRYAQQIKKQYKKDNPEEFITEIQQDISTLIDRNKIADNRDASRTEFKTILEKFESYQDKEEEDKNDITKPFYLYNRNGKFYIVHTPAEKCKQERMFSGWLLPDGTFYAGNAAFIHLGILSELKERGYFEDKEYGAGEDSVQDDGNWIKCYSGEWFIWEHKHKLTKQQVEFIIDFTINVKQKTFVKAGSLTLIHLSVFSRLLDGITQFDAYEMAKESDPIIAAEIKALHAQDGDNAFPTVEQVSDIDPLSRPFFMPDNTFVKWLIAYANGRVIVDIGCGSGYLTAKIISNKGKAIGVEPFWDAERIKFWAKHNIHFNVLSQRFHNSIAKTFPAKKTLFVFARPCHGDFVQSSIDIMPNGAEILYIGHADNFKFDLGNIKYTELKYDGTCKMDELVLSIKK